MATTTARMDSVYWMLSSVSVVLCLWSVAVVSAASSDAVVVVDCPFGQIQGVKKTDEGTGQPYVSFKGIPYAKAPVGQLRFAKPQPHPNIEGVFDATKNTDITCPHPDLMTFRATGFTEDCLVLNIFARATRSKGEPLKKVMVFIHGGGFVVGSGYFYTGKRFAITQDVIVVSINYRLGVLGYLSTGNEASPGNYGLWDQTLALKWVKDNIRAFGGDPNDITLAGESAGGASVGYQMITPHAKGLFTKAYPQSGTASSTFGIAVDPQSAALGIAKTNGCWEKETDRKLDVDESKAVVACLRELPLSAFTAFSGFSLAGTVFVPVVDGDFISDAPANLIKDDAYLDSVGFFDRSYLIAVNNAEWSILDNFLKGSKKIIFDSNQTSTEEKEAIWDKVIQSAKHLNLALRLGHQAASDPVVVGAVDEFYNRRIADNYKAALELVTDLYFLLPSLEFASVAARRDSTNVRVLHFDHFPTYLKGQHKGSSHGLDLIYWLDVEMEDMEPLLRLGMKGEMPEEDLKLREMFSTLIGDFVRSGNPGLALQKVLPSGWPKYDAQNAYVLNFNPNPWVSNFLAKDKQDFWFKTVPSLLEDTHHEHHEHTEL